MEVQAALGSDIALVFDECTPFHGGRDYTARSTERTHRWLDRCLEWHREHGPEWQVVYGIVQGGVEEDLRRASAQEVAARATGGIAIGGTLGEDKDQMFEVVGWALVGGCALQAHGAAWPRHDIDIAIERQSHIRLTDISIRRRQHQCRRTRRRDRRLRLDPPLLAIGSGWNDEHGFAPLRREG